MKTIIIILASIIVISAIVGFVVICKEFGEYLEMEEESLKNNFDL